MIIHFGWVGSPVPGHVDAAVEAARRASPASEVMLHADERDVPALWRDTMDALDLRPHMRSDVQRHAVLRRYGGLWLDADVRLVRDPAEWTTGWDRYTAVRLRERPSIIGTDIIYAPAGWDGWPLVEAEIDHVLGRTVETGRVGVLALAHRMLDICQRRRRAAFAILEPGTRFPFSPNAFTTDSVVARGFDPPAEPRPGLGDRVASALSAVGITETRVARIASTVGIKDCGCRRRREALNRAGRRLGIG